MSSSSSVVPNSSPPLHVGLAGWNVAPALGYDSHGAIGGLETFACQLAAALADRPRRRVSFLIRHVKPIPDARWRGVELETLVEPLRDTRLAVSQSLEKLPHFPWLRWKQFRWPLLWQIPLLAVSRLGRRGGPRERLIAHLRKFSPDVWVTLGCSAESAAMIREAAASHTPSILWLQSNADLNPRFFAEEGFVNPYGVKSLDARDAIRQATCVVCQTQIQLEQVSDLRLGSNVVIPNPIQADRWHRPEIPLADRRHVLWIGRYDRFHKRPLLCLEVARRLPDIPLRMIVSGGDREVEQEVRQTLPANVTLVNRVPHAQMPEEFRHARVFLSTGSGEHEGFPNVLLEASAAGVPIASFEDFDDYLDRSSAGASGDGHLDKVCGIVRQLWTNPEAWQQASINASSYVRREHDLSVIVAEFDLLLEQVHAHGRRAPA